MPDEDFEPDCPEDIDRPYWWEDDYEWIVKDENTLYKYAHVAYN